MVSSSHKAPFLYSIPALGYDTSIFELSDQIPGGLKRWQADDLLAVLAARSTFEKGRRELSIYYYRIYHTMAFPLPLDRRPSEFPAGIPGRSWYPWLIWLLWGLDERWRTLHAAWRHLNDAEAGEILQRELAALDGWRSYTAWNDQVGLPTGHIAACLTRFLADSAGWDADLYRRATGAAQKLVEQDLWPWFEKEWAAERDLGPHDIHNIPVIALVRGAQLARFIGFAHSDILEARAVQALRAWWRHRSNAEAPHTEGVSYDGFLMDSFTEWLDGLPNRDALAEEGRPWFASLLDQWTYSTLPGRPDLHAPLGDVEGEMPFWMTCVLRIANWYGGQGDAGPGLWLLQHLSPVRLPAAAVAYALDNPRLISAAPAPPAPGPKEVANAAILRTGWDSEDVLALLGLSRSSMSHLHDDGGQLIIGWRNRFWITDPGYQQYRPGEEREFSMGLAAHNGPVIDGQGQTRRSVRLLHLETTAEGWQHAALDLTGCYEGLPDAARVQRYVWLRTGEAPVVVVRDTVTGLSPTAEIRTHWQGGAHLAWAFVEGWARLSDGAQALWIGSLPGALSPAMLERHAASRGPLTLTYTAAAQESHTHWWIFCGDAGGGWTAPAVTLDDGRVQVQSPGSTWTPWT